MQVRCTALFGSKVEEIFLLMQRARRDIEMSAGMLLRDPEPIRTSHGEYPQLSGPVEFDQLAIGGQYHYWNLSADRVG